MAKKIAYDETRVIRSLSKKNSIRVNTSNRVIEILRDSTDVGNGSWGKIDYLCKVHNYSYAFVSSISGKRKFRYDDEISSNRITKAAKREAKINMAAMTKLAMRNARNK